MKSLDAAKEGWDWAAEKSRISDTRLPLSLLPRNRGRRWPTGRMRGPSRKAACEKIPRNVRGMSLCRNCALLVPAYAGMHGNDGLQHAA
jgi:hypothetical protein